MGFLESPSKPKSFWPQKSARNSKNHKACFLRSRRSFAAKVTPDSFLEVVRIDALEVKGAHRN